MFRFSAYLLNSLKYYWRTNLGVVAGASIGTAVLVGALISGDSVKFSLLELSLKRLGNTHYAIETESHYFRSELANEIGKETNTITTGVLHISGALQKGSQKRLGMVQVYGVDQSFGKFTVGGRFPETISDSHVAVSQRVADLMELGPGDQLMLRVEKDLVVPLDTPVASKEDRFISIPVKVTAILSDSQLGRFSLRSNQFVPNNIFINRSFLARKMGMENKSNLILSQAETTLEKLNEALAQHIQLEDLSLSIRDVPELNQMELISDKVFIPRSIGQAVAALPNQVEEVLSYFVNEIAAGENAVPYSFAAGVPSINSQVLSGNEIIINEWTARELGVMMGDSLRLRFYVMDVQGALIEKSHTFVLKGIVPLRGGAADRLLMPAFPGLGDAETCGDWRPGIPIDLNKIRTQDEAYWDTYRGTPKAFISVATAQELWANKFGKLTALRFPSDAGSMPELTRKLLEVLPPEAQGLRFDDVRQSAIAATSGGVDFGQLFMGLSFFIILSANLLTALLFIFNTEQRTAETRQLLALGYLPGQIKSLRLWEGLVLSIAGGLIGLLLGVGYSRFIMFGLGTFWRDAVGFSDFQLHLSMSKMLTGFVAGILVSFVSIWLVIKKQISWHIQAQKADRPFNPPKWNRNRNYHLAVLVLILIAAISIVLKQQAGQIQSLAMFYTAAVLLLAGGLHFCYILSREIKNGKTKRDFMVTGLVLSNWSRSSGRNLTTITLLATGIFIVVSVGLNQHDPTSGGSNIESGSGGYELYLETSMPVLDDLNITQNTAHGTTSVNDHEKIGFIQFRKKSGDDGSCLNLNMVNKPQVLGLRSGELAGHFTFSKMLDLGGSYTGWDVLGHEFEAGVIPAVADMSVIQWGLGLGLGDTLHYVDEWGKDLKLILVAGLANSVFQGNVIIAEKNFDRYYPSISGTQIFLVDAQDPLRAQKILELTLKEYGLQIDSCNDRLVAFGAVENTYLSIFLMLGGFGLLIGTVGMGIVMLRNILERRWEIALMQALGFTARKVFKIIYLEQLITLVLGLFIGAIAALVSILPTLSSSDPGEMLRFALLLILAVIINSLLWIALAVKFAFKSEIAGPLSDE